MADDRIRREPDDLDLDDDLIEEEAGGVAELPADDSDDEFEEEE